MPADGTITIRLAADALDACRAPPSLTAAQQAEYEADAASPGGSGNRRLHQGNSACEALLAKWAPVLSFSGAATNISQLLQQVIGSPVNPACVPSAAEQVMCARYRGVLSWILGLTAICNGANRVCLHAKHLERSCVGSNDSTVGAASTHAVATSKPAPHSTACLRAASLVLCFHCHAKVLLLSFWCVAQVGNGICNNGILNTAVCGWDGRWKASWLMATS